MDDSSIKLFPQNILSATLNTKKSLTQNIAPEGSRATQGSNIALSVSIS